MKIDLNRVVVDCVNYLVIGCRNKSFYCIYDEQKWIFFSLVKKESQYRTLTETILTNINILTTS